jgi:hypothetical protein
MDETKTVYVDYTLYTPIGRVNHVGGPFGSSEEATKFISEVKKAYGPALLKSDVRTKENSND